MKIFRMGTVLLVTVFLAIGLVAPISAQAKPDFAKVWDSKIITFNYGSGITMQVNGISSGTIYGVAPQIRTLLESYPESKTTFHSFESKDVLGQTLLWGGVATALAGAFTSIALRGASGAPTTGSYVALGFSLTGLTAEVIGAFIFQSSYQDLFNSVNTYNRKTMENFSTGSVTP